MLAPQPTAQPSAAPAAPLEVPAPPPVAPSPLHPSTSPTPHTPLAGPGAPGLRSVRAGGDDLAVLPAAYRSWLPAAVRVVAALLITVGAGFLVRNLPDPGSGVRHVPAAPVTAVHPTSTGGTAAGVP